MKKLIAKSKKDRQITGVNEYKFMFSVVIPVHNVEEYLEEAVESILNQDIGFKRIAN